MAKIVIYVKDNCPYCKRAQALLEQKGTNFDIIHAGRDVDLRAEMVEKSGGRTSFPQIFINDMHIGGCDNLYELDESGKLDPLLAVHVPLAGESS